MKNIIHACLGLFLLGLFFGCGGGGGDDSPSVPGGMVLIPDGTNSGADPDFGVYSITVDSFYMDSTEVTKAQWDEVYGWAINNGYIFDNSGLGKASNHPVQNVDWYDCVIWCNARSEMDGRTPCYNLSDWSCNTSENGYRLPSSVEWEYAARGGLRSKRFPWGDTVTHNQANYRHNGNYGYDISDTGGYHPDYNDGEEPYTSPVGSFEPNGYGLYDMSGNVYEWCNNSSSDGSHRCFRSGSWWCYADHLRCGRENWNTPTCNYRHTGFRSVCR